ncbi:hypothetical protein JTB14_021641 [Gonioctena quinquepunctata]|nr:hypothetical protein JTB14_021641 [Gonioctena quinquepunctata]
MITTISILEKENSSLASELKKFEHTNKYLKDEMKGHPLLFTYNENAQSIQLTADSRQLEEQKKLGKEKMKRNEVEVNQKLKLSNENAIKKTPQRQERGSLENEFRIKISRKDIHSSKSSPKGNILIVAGNFGKNLASVMNAQTHGNYAIQSMIKTNAPDEVLIKTAVQNSLSFNKGDLVILWPNMLDYSLRTEICDKLKNTNLILITEPFKHNLHGRWNGEVYRRNLATFEKFHREKLHNHILECNNFLRKSNFITRGYRTELTRNGTYFLTKSIISHMLTKFDLNRTEKFPLSREVKTRNSGTFNQYLASPTTHQTFNQYLASPTTHQTTKNTSDSFLGRQK